MAFCNVLISFSIIGIFNVDILLPVLKVTGFHQGILKLALEPSLLGTALMKGGPDRKIKLDCSPAVDEVKSVICISCERINVKFCYFLCHNPFFINVDGRISFFDIFLIS